MEPNVKQLIMKYLISLRDQISFTYVCVCVCVCLCLSTVEDFAMMSQTCLDVRNNDLM